MADRSVVVRLMASVGQYVAGMNQAAGATRRLETSAATAGAAATGLGSATGRAGAAQGRFATATAGAAAASQRLGATTGQARDAQGRFAAATTQAAGASQALGRSTMQARDAQGRFASAATAAGNSARTGAVSVKGLAVAGGALGVGLGFMVKTSMDFDKAMSAVRANVDATPAQFDALTQSVKGAGTQYGFTATESAAATEELAKAGLTTSDIMGGALTGALTLAAAGGVSAGEAAETAATSMSMFGLKAGDVGRIADVLANGANQSTASIGSLSQALQQGGGVAASFGLSLEDTVATLAMFDQNGLKGSDAGTSLKTMLSSLAKPSKQAQAALDDLGISAFDAGGKFVGMSSLQEQLKTKMGGLTQAQRQQAMATIFGSDAMRAANVLFKDTKGFDTWKDGVSKTGTAAENARTRLDNLSGDLGKLKSALQNAAISGGGAASTFLRPLAQGATNLLQALAGLPTGVQTAALGLTALAGGGLLAAAGVVKAVGFIRSLNTEVRAGVGAMRAYTGAQITARAAAIGTAEAQGVQAGVMAASARSFTAQGAALVTLAGGQTVAMGVFGSGVALIGRAIPTIGALQAAYMTAATGGSKLAAANMAASASIKGLAAAGAIVGLAYASSSIQDWAAKADVADVSADSLAKSLGSLKSGTAAGGLADLFRENGSSVSVFGKQIGAGREQVVSTSDVIKRFKTDLDNAGATGIDAFARKTGLWGGNMEAAKKRLKELDDALVSMIKNGRAGDAKGIFAELTKGMSPEDVEKTKKALSGYSSEIAKIKDAAPPAASATKKAADSIDLMGKSSQEAKDDVDSLAKALKGLGSDQLDVRQAARDYQAAIDDATKSLKENGRTLDQTTEKGRSNGDNLDKIASQTTAWAAAQVQLTGSMSQANGIIAAGKKQYVDMAVAMGQPRAQAQALADEIFKLPKGVSTSVKVDGLGDAVYKLNEAGDLVVQLQGKKVTIPFDAPNAANTAALLYGIKGAVTDAQGKTVTIPTSALGVEGTRTALTGIKGARLDANGNVQIPTTALNAQATMSLLGSIGRLAVDADGKKVVIPASAPNAPLVAQLIKNIRGAQVTTDGKQVRISTSAPLAVDTKQKINNIKGAQVSADGKSVRINSSTPNYSATLTSISNILAAAHDKTMTITIVTQMQQGADLGVSLGLGLAAGGISPGEGITRMAAGGVRPAMMADKPILWAEAGPEAYIPLGAARRHAPRTRDIFERTAGVLGYDVKRRAAQGYMSAPAYRSEWARAMPVAPAGGVQRVDTSGIEARLDVVAKATASNATAIAGLSSDITGMQVVLSGSRLHLGVVEAGKDARRGGGQGIPVSGRDVVR